MNKNTQALHDYLIKNLSTITKDWMDLRYNKKGSHYSADANPEIAQRIESQMNQYAGLIAKSLNQTEPEMKSEIIEFTNQTAVERANSNTSIIDVSEQLRNFRRVYWKQIEQFLEIESDTVSVKELLEWEKTINMTLDFIFENFTTVFMRVLMDRVTSQQDVIRELSTPIIPLSNEVGVLPLVGVIDSVRANDILEITLGQSVRLDITTLIMDLSGVPMVDTMVANEIFKIITSLRLLGISTILTGIRPEVAQTSVQLGIDFKEIPTYSSLKQAIKLLQDKNAKNH
ncbi:MAG: STAS domain-containing protein [Planococcaceae bacterium]|nr:STAS domain-containing protein [Planococcaceae bacterium]